MISQLTLWHWKLTLAISYFEPSVNEIFIFILKWFRSCHLRIKSIFELSDKDCHGKHSMHHSLTSLVTVQPNSSKWCLSCEMRWSPPTLPWLKCKQSHDTAWWMTVYCNLVNAGSKLPPITQAVGCNLSHHMLNTFMNWTMFSIAWSSHSRSALSHSVTSFGGLWFVVKFSAPILDICKYQITYHSSESQLQWNQLHFDISSIPQHIPPTFSPRLIYPQSLVSGVSIHPYPQRHLSGPVHIMRQDLPKEVHSALVSPPFLPSQCYL